MKYLILILFISCTSELPDYHYRTVTFEDSTYQKTVGIYDGESRELDVTLWYGELDWSNTTILDAATLAPFQVDTLSLDTIDTL